MTNTTNTNTNKIARSSRMRDLNWNGLRKFEELFANRIEGWHVQACGDYVCFNDPSFDPDALTSATCFEVRESRWMTMGEVVDRWNEITGDTLEIA